MPRRNELHEELLFIVRTNPDTCEAKVYSVGTDCIIIKDCWDGCVQVLLAWCRIDRVTLCFVLGSDKALADYSRVPKDSLLFVDSQARRAALLSWL